MVGTAVGALVVTPLALLGFRAATNNSVSSGAYFGVRGRLVASVIGLLLCLGYVALTIWTGGEALVAVTDRSLGTEESVLQDVLGYGLLAVAIAVVAIYGYRWLLRVNTIIVIVVGAAMLLSVIGLADKFDATCPGSPDLYALGSFWPTWLLAALTAGIAGPLSYVTQLGDWTRYISPRRHKPGTLLIGMFVGLLGGLLIHPVGRLRVVNPVRREQFSRGPGDRVPSWLLIPVVLAALVGSIGQGAMVPCVGLDLDAILPRLTRMQATIVMTVVSTVLVFPGQVHLGCRSRGHLVRRLPDLNWPLRGRRSP